MYSLSVRVNSVFFYFGVCTAILGAFNILTTIMHKGTPIVKKFEYETEYLYYHNYAKVQHATPLLDIDIDYTPCFNWNSNLVFTWISATYQTQKPGKKEHTTSVTIWDNIMKRDDIPSHHVVLNKKIAEYPLIDINNGLSEKNVTLELHWEHMPVIGPILKHKVFLKNITIPKKAKTPSLNRVYRELDYSDESAY